jgi:outer membrane protein assembly factor BamB
MDPVGPQWTSSWSKNLGGPVSYPLIADGEVFVLVDSSVATIYAFDASTGAVKWQVDPPGGALGIAFDNGRLFEQSSDEMYAYDALTGQLDWSTPLAYENSMSAPPVAADGIVYSNGGGGETVYAFSESTGALLWSAPAETYGGSSPTVGADGVYVSGGCDLTQALDPTTGSRLWDHFDGCYGGGGQTAVLAHGYLYLGDVVLNASTGAAVSSMESSVPPAVDGSNVYVDNDGILAAQTVTDSHVLWSFGGDGQLSTPPIVDDGVVYEGSGSGALYGVSAATGQLLWSTNVGTPVEPGTLNQSWGMAEGDGLLAVPAEDTLTVFDDPFTPPSAPGGVSASLSASSAQVRWQVPPDNGSAIDSFTITPTVNGVEQTPIVIPAGAVGSATDPTPGAADTYTVTGLMAGDSYVFSVAADNGGGRGPGTTAPFAPAITSVPGAAFGLGQPDSFTVTTTGLGAPTIQEVGTLPAGVNFTDNGDGTATLSGAAAAGSLGSYPITVSVTNVVGTASQSFLLTLAPPVVITTTTGATFTVGSPGSFPFGASGSPAPTFSETGRLPYGVSLSPGGMLAGTPAEGAAGTYPITVTASNGLVPDATADFVLTVDGAPVITSAPSAAFAAGQFDSFTMVTKGYPLAGLEEAGTLPAGVIFTDNGNGTATLSGVPVPESLGTYPITVTADNGVGAAAVQNFVLTVGTAPTIISNATSTFMVGSAGSFTVQASGSPAPAWAETGPLPAGVTFSSGGELTGIPAAGTAGSYPITVVAANGVAPTATQSFVLEVNAAPAFTSPADLTVVAGDPADFSVTTSGFPVSAISETGSLPSGMTLTDEGNGTATLAGTPQPAAIGAYPITLLASNGPGGATQNFVLTIGQSPEITSPSVATFTVGTPVSFDFLASGFPAATFSVDGELPPGVTLAPGGTGLVGTPAPGSGGFYSLGIAANNGLPPQTVQNLNVAVDYGPSITSPAVARFAAGQADSFLVTTTGLPASGLEETGTLPSGVTFSDNGNGTATIAGDPVAGTGGSYPITVTAGNGVAPDATQSFDLEVYQPLAIISSPSASFAPLVPGSFTFETSGPPTPTFDETGTLPAGVTLSADGTLAGTPAAGTQGTYPITVVASNPQTAATQAFTLNVGLVITTTSLPSRGTERYSATMSAVGGDPPYRWSLASGSLPPGLHLNKRTGVISGRPRKDGTFTFTVQVVDTGTKAKPHRHDTATKTLAITIL